MMQKSAFSGQQSAGKTWILRVTYGTVSAWIMFSESTTLRGKSDWSKEKILRAWKSCVGLITELVELKGKFSWGAMMEKIAEIQPKKEAA